MRQMKTDPANLLGFTLNYSKWTICFALRVRSGPFARKTICSFSILPNCINVFKVIRCSLMCQKLHKSDGLIGYFVLKRRPTTKNYHSYNPLAFYQTFHPLSQKRETCFVKQHDVITTNHPQ